MRICSRIAVLVTAAFLVGTMVRAFPQAPAQAKKSVPKSGRAHAKPRAVSADSQAAQPYQVRRGDSLYTIARAHGTSVGAVKSANQLRTNRLKIGQRLRLPFSEEAATGHTRIAGSGHDAPPTEPGNTATPVKGEDTAEKILPGVSVSPEVQELPSAASTEEQTDPESDAASQPLRVRLASMGIGLLGVRYRWSGNSEVGGYDCSGLVKSLFDKFNISLPRSSREQYKVGEKVDKDKLEVGDLVFFSSRRSKTPSHVGIYIGDNQFLHAARKARRVIISSLSANWYTMRFLGARRLADLWAEEPPPADDNSN